MCIISKPSLNSNWSYSLETLQWGENLRFFIPWDCEIWHTTLKNNRVPLLCCLKICASFHCHLWIQIGVTVWKSAIWVEFFVPCHIEIWGMTLKNNMTPLLCYLKICASFHCHLWIQTGVTVQKRLIWVEIRIFFPCDLEIWWMTFFYATLSFVHHFMAIGPLVNLKWSESPEKSNLTPIERFQTITPVWIHWCLWNNAESLT